MKGLAALALGLLAVAASPAVAFACPMCFDGGNSNQSAFLYGSLFLMVVPVTVIGGLMYWAYRRIRAAEAGERVERPGQPAAGAASENDRDPSRLHMVRR